MVVRTILVLLLGVNMQAKAAPAPPSDENSDQDTHMIDKLNGWRLNQTDSAVDVFRTNDGGRKWIKVSPALLGTVSNDAIAAGGPVDLSPLDANRAWIAIIVGDHVTLEYTSTGGRKWDRVAGPKAIDVVAISFVDENAGFVLCFGYGVGRDTEAIYSTKDGCRTWETMNRPPNDGYSYHANGICFSNSKDGWITATYHGGPDAPLFHTTDGGKTWSLQSFPIPSDYQGGYADVFPPVLGVNHHGYLPVRLVRHKPQPGHFADVNYETDDGGITWRLPATGVHSIADQ